jgi:hypothetical protein
MAPEADPIVTNAPGSAINGQQSTASNQRPAIKGRKTIS